MSGNSHHFDRATVTHLATERINERWRGMVSIEYGGPHHVPSGLQPIEATLRLRAGLGHAIQDVRSLCGRLGEYLPPADFVAAADRTWNDVVLPTAKKVGSPPERMIAPFADPNWRMVEIVIQIWEKNFFDPQTSNAARMMLGLTNAASMNGEAARPAYELAKRLRSATIEPGASSLDGLLGEVVEFLRIFAGASQHQMERPTVEAGGRPGATTRRVQPVSANEARDKWLYDQACKGATWKTIRANLRKRPKSWEQIGSDNGIKAATHRYANRHGLSPPPVRKAGRKPR